MLIVEVELLKELVAAFVESALAPVLGPVGCVRDYGFGIVSGVIYLLLAFPSGGGKGCGEMAYAELLGFEGCGMHAVAETLEASGSALGLVF